MGVRGVKGRQGRQTRLGKAGNGKKTASVECSYLLARENKSVSILFLCHITMKRPQDNGESGLAKLQPKWSIRWYSRSTKKSTAKIPVGSAFKVHNLTCTYTSKMSASKVKALGHPSCILAPPPSTIARHLGGARVDVSSDKVAFFVFWFFEFLLQEKSGINTLSSEGQSVQELTYPPLSRSCGGERLSSYNHCPTRLRWTILDRDVLYWHVEFGTFVGQTSREAKKATENNQGSGCVQDVPDRP